MIQTSSEVKPGRAGLVLDCILVLQTEAVVMIYHSFSLAGIKYR